MITGILKPSGGVLEVNGLIPYDNRIKQAQIMGVVFGQRSQLWWDLPVIELFKILKEIYKVDQKTFKHHMELFNDQVGLKALYSQQVRILTLGQRMQYRADFISYALYIIAISPMQILFDHFWQIRHPIQQGTFIKYFFRPLNIMFYYIFEMFDLKGITQLFVGIGLLIYSSFQLQLDWPLIRVLILLMTLFSAALVQISIIVSASCAAFWVIYSYPVLGLAWRLREFPPTP